MDEKILSAHGLTLEEYKRILDLIGREPNEVELGIFGALWSEHCSYKSSKPYLKVLASQKKSPLRSEILPRTKDFRWI
jgi:phosphoribosylformylglycinamidine synthase